MWGRGVHVELSAQASALPAVQGSRCADDSAWNGEGWGTRVHGGRGIESRGGEVLSNCQLLPPFLWSPQPPQAVEW